MKEKIEVNLLELIPEKLIDQETDENGMITLLVPRFRNRFLKIMNDRSPHRRFVKMKLDEIGSCAWSSIDGKKNIRQIGETLRENFGEQIEPCYDRLSMFMTKLEYEKYIRYINLDHQIAGTE
ncbi:MAG: PqqD family protein [Candidatus Krumholzibacteriota bacterium]|nr:PqqD family protein [Candidatus Krumholzibacteriota bacterium]